MENQITITDDFDLYKIIYSGQCFRPTVFDDGTFRFITGSHILYIRRALCDTYDISCSLDEWDSIWHGYFNLDKNYASIRSRIPDDDVYMTEAARMGQGIRILRQDSFEMLLSFIISQRKSIPAIRSCVEKICCFYGKKVKTPLEEVCLFPTPENILNQGFAPLSECSLGYRHDYIIAATEAVVRGDLDLDHIGQLDDDALLDALMALKGVGIKVASCIALFAYDRGSIAPVDTWINRVIEEEYKGHNPFPDYGQNSGIFQQYAFYRATHTH